MVNNQYNL